MKQFSVYLSIVTCLIISAYGDKPKNDWEPISKSCKAFQNLQTFNMQKCEQTIFWGTSYCNYSCNKAGEVITSDCQYNSNDVDYPLCNDLYCASAKEDKKDEGSEKKSADEAGKTDEKPKPEETTAAASGAEAATTVTPAGETTTAAPVAKAK